MKKIVITGATGLVGSHLAVELLRRGERDITLVLRDAGRLERMTATLEREGVEHTGVKFKVIETELTNPVELKKAFEGADVVYNCAAAVSLGAMDDEVLVDGNVQIARHVVNACIDAGVRLLVHVSSIAALGSPPENGTHDGVKYIDETMTPESLDGLPPYYVGKLLSENEVWRGVACGLRAVVVNPALVLGSGEQGAGSSAAMNPYLTKGVPFYTDGVVGVVDVRDVGRAMVELAACERAVGERFILCGSNVSYRELLTFAAAAAGLRPPRIRAGKALLGAAWRGAWLAGKLTGQQLLFTRDLAEVLLKKTYYSSAKIQNLTGFEFTPVEETITRIVREYLKKR
ncbi:MAG: NAD-dependent epimerase/dehydratase family protein [Rikenellaceae bacterium]|nr:NAD-dependent epimerase/dehydratase family protein [Rikenellaceae bacterium]MCL2692861.1 NAD-dependent epimerase/dehydratase family protein [Rikenellaceae bacterium]